MVQLDRSTGVDNQLHGISCSSFPVGSDACLKGKVNNLVQETVAKDQISIGSFKALVQ